MFQKVSISIGAFQHKFGDRRALEIAHECGADPAWMHRMNFERLHRILSYAREFQVQIAMETFGKIDNTHCDFFGNYDEFIKSYEQICSEGIMTDILHPRFGLE